MRGEWFGYLNRAAGLHAATWPDAFGLMVGALLDDAARWHTALPDDEIRSALHRHREALAQVTTASLIHMDLWAANLFVDAAGGLTGVIDPERAVWGDPLLEIVGADQLGRGIPAAELLDGYAGAGGRFALGTAAGDTRLALYRVYMSLVLLVEIAPRGFSGDWVAGHREAATANLRAALDSLA